MNRIFSIAALTPLVAAGLLAAAASRPEKPPAADAAAVDDYVARLSSTVPPPAASRLANQPARDGKVSKATARIDRIEPVANAVIDIAG